MNNDALENFIDLQDEENNIDTKGKYRVSPRDTTPVDIKSFEESVSSPSSSGRKHLHTQSTPTKATPDSHPLKDNDHFSTNCTNSTEGVIKRSNTWQRKSLIMPILSPNNTPKQSSQTTLHFHSHSHSHSHVQDSFSDTPPGRKQRTRDNSIESQMSKRSSGGSISSILPDTLDGTNTNTNNSPIADSARNTYLQNENTDVSGLLQSLANKELEILERTKRVHDLKRQIMLEDKVIHQINAELHILKKKVSELVGNQVVSQTNQTASAKQTSTSKTESKLPESLWTRSVSLFNQFDQMIQGTVENRLGLVDSSPNDAPRKHNDQLNCTQAKKQEENPIWSIVNDFKQGLGLLEIEEEEDDNNERTKESQKNASRRKDPNNRMNFIADSSRDRNHSDSESEKGIEMHHYR